MLLREEDLIARGKLRSVYKFPYREQYLLKLAEVDDGIETQTGLRGYLKRHYPYARYRNMFCEMEHETKIQMRAMLKGVRSPISPTRGMVSSEKTLGLLVKQVSQKDGSIGLTLDELFAKGMFDEKALAALNEFAQLFFMLGIVAGDIHAKNIVWGDLEGELTPFLVDGYSDKNFIPLKTYIPWVRYRKLHKCFVHMAKKIGCEWVRSERVFKFQD